MSAPIYWTFLTILLALAAYLSALGVAMRQAAKHAPDTEKPGRRCQIAAIAAADLVLVLLGLATLIHLLVRSAGTGGWNADPAPHPHALRAALAVAGVSVALIVLVAIGLLRATRPRGPATTATTETRARQLRAILCWAAVAAAFFILGGWVVGTLHGAKTILPAWVSDRPHRLVEPALLGAFVGLAFYLAGLHAIYAGRYLFRRTDD